MNHEASAPMKYYIVCMFTINYLVRCTMQLDVPEFNLHVLKKSENENFFKYILRIECLFCEDASFCRPYSQERNALDYSQRECFSCGKCRTDKDCGRYGDCCPSELLTTQNGMCVSTILAKGQPFGKPVGNRVIAKCPAEAPSVADREACEFHDKRSRNITRNIPVTDKSGLTFRNRYCASCNKKEDYTTWGTNVLCRDEYSLSSTLTYEEMMGVIWDNVSCEINLIRPQKFARLSRECDLNPKDRVISRCNVTGNWVEYDAGIETACNNYDKWFKFRIGYTLTYFRNVFCFLCNVDVLESFRTCKYYVPLTPAPIWGTTTRSTDGGGGRPGVFMTFSSILNFNLDDSKVGKAYTVRDCGRGMMYDVTNDTCREVHCIPGWWLSDEHCVKVIETDEWVEYYITVIFQIVSPLDQNDCEKKLSSPHFTDKLYDEMAKINGSHDTFTFYKSIQIDEIWGVPNEKCKNNTKIPPHNTPDNIDNIEDLTILGCRIRLGYLMKNRNFTDELRAEISEVFTKVYDVRLGDDVISIRPDRNATHLHEQTGNIQMEGATRVSVRSTTGRDTRPNNVYYLKQVPLSRFLLCPYVMLSENEFSLMDNGTLLLIHNTTMPLQTDFFSLESGPSARVCAENVSSILARSLQDSHEHPAFSLAHGIVSLVCTCVSVLCLLITFIIYCAVKAMRTLPGLNNMSLVFTLIIAQMIYQFGVGQNPDNRYVCEVIGIVAHYIWLVVVFWMNVCCVYMFRIFGSSNLATRVRSKSWQKTYSRHAIYAFFAPLCIVLVCITVSLINSSGATLGYVGVYCFIADKVLLGCTLALPVAIIVIINIALFIKVVTSINIQSKVGSVLVADRHYVHIYVRLSTITGLTWIFGFLHQLTAEDAFGYLFTVFNASQGVFIFIAFIFSRTTLRHFKELKRQQESRSRSSNITASTQI